jgi:Domain of unknown function (DUF4406)
MIARVYIAGPYTKGDLAVNVRKAYEAANRLADLGFAPFVPHATHFWHMLFPRPYEFWLELDSEFLPLCEAVLRLPGASNGADGEVKQAKELGIPVCEDITVLVGHFGSRTKGRPNAGTVGSPATKATERSVNTIQSIYAIVIALAISEATQSFLTGPDGHVNLRVKWLLAGLPAFIAFLVTLVPFWHGMNRHLDRCYLEKTEGVKRWAIPIDFFVFLWEAALLFAAGLTLRSGIETFICLGLLLALDMVWAFISHQIHFRGRKSHALWWSLINAVTMVIAILVVAWPFEGEPLFLMAMALLRTIADYVVCREFYFPATAPPVNATGGGQQAAEALAGSA